MGDAVGWNSSPGMPETITCM